MRTERQRMDEERNTPLDILRERLVQLKLTDPSLPLSHTSPFSAHIYICVWLYVYMLYTHTVGTLIYI